MPEEGEGHRARTTVDLDPGPEQGLRSGTLPSRGSKGGRNWRFGHQGGNPEHSGEGGWLQGGGCPIGRGPLRSIRSRIRMDARPGRRSEETGPDCQSRHRMVDSEGRSHRAKIFAMLQCPQSPSCQIQRGCDQPWSFRGSPLRSFAWPSLFFYRFPSNPDLLPP